MWSQICIQNFIPASFFNEWLENMGLWEIDSRNPNCTDSLRNFTASDFFKCSNCFGCSSWDSRKFWQNISTDDNAYHSQFSDSKCSWSVAVGISVVQRCSVKKVFLEFLKNWQENTCARVSFLIKLQASGPGTGVFLWILSWNTSGGCFWNQSLLSFQFEKLHEIECLVFLAYSWLK